METKEIFDFNKETKFRNSVLCNAELNVQHKSQSIYYCKHVIYNRVCIAFYLFVYVRRPEGNVVAEM